MQRDRISEIAQRATAGSVNDVHLAGCRQSAGVAVRCHGFYFRDYGFVPDGVGVAILVFGNSAILVDDVGSIGGF